MHPYLDIKRTTLSIQRGTPDNPQECANIVYAEKQLQQPMAATRSPAKERGAIRLSVLGILENRDIVLRAISAACKHVTFRPGWSDFQNQVVSAVSEAFNNLVLHAYKGRRDGRVDFMILTKPNAIEIEIRDWGKGFDPKAVPVPALDVLPESGLGLFIMRAFMNVRYRRGRPNLLVLKKHLEEAAASDQPATSGTS